MQVWIVVAAYNEADRLEATLRDLLSTGHEIVVVDDGSIDDTRAVAARFPVWTLRHPVNCGQGAAIRTGITFALDREADVIVTFDADGQHDAADIAAIVAPIADGRAAAVDVVLGSRFLGRAIDMPPARRLLLAAASWFTFLVTGVSVTDPHNGMRALSRRAAGTMRITHDGMAHASEIVEQLAALRLRFCEAPVTVRYTAATLAKGQRPWNAIRVVGDLIAGRMVK